MGLLLGGLPQMHAMLHASLVGAVAVAAIDDFEDNCRAGRTPRSERGRRVAYRSLPPFVAIRRPIRGRGEAPHSP